MAASTPLTTFNTTNSTTTFCLQQLQLLILSGSHESVANYISDCCHHLDSSDNLELFNQQDKLGLSVLMLLCKLKISEAAEELVNCGVSLQCKDLQGRKAIHYAVSNGLVQVVLAIVTKCQQELESQARWDVSNFDLILYPIHQAVVEKQTEVFDALSGHDRKLLKWTTPETSFTVLHLACMQDSDFFFFHILEKMCNIGESQDKLSSLKTIMLQNKEYLNFLQEKNKFENEAMFITCLFYGHYTIVDFITDLIPNAIKSLNFDNNLPIHAAVLRNHVSLVSYFLLKDRQLINSVNSRWETVFHLIKTNNNDLLNELIKYSDDFDFGQQSTLGCTVAQTFAACGQVKGLEMLKEKNVALLDEADNDGDTPLCQAAAAGHLECLRLLVNSGCDLNHKNCKNETPFFLACKYHQVEAVKFMADTNKVDIKHRDHSGNTALLIACASKPRHSDFDALIQLLLAKGLIVWDENYVKENALFKSFTADDDATFALYLLVLLQESGICTLNLLHNSEGMNITHYLAFKCKNIQMIVGDNDLLNNYVSCKVDKGIYKGYSCLHFACESNSQLFPEVWKTNIIFLLNKNLKLKERNGRGQTCVDLAVDQSNAHLLFELSHVKSLSFHYVISLIDNVITDVKMPTLEEAKAFLFPSCSAQLIGQINTGNYLTENRPSGSVINTGTGDILIYSTAVHLLAIAFREDSQTAFRSLLALNIWDSCLEPKFASNFFVFMRTNYEKYLTFLNNGFNSSVAKMIKEIKNSTSQNDESLGFSFPTLVGLALRAGRVCLVKDLLLMEQVYLVPLCLQTLIECNRLKTVENIQPVYLTEVEGHVKTVLINTLQCLFVSAKDDRDKDDNDNKLLFSYLLGAIPFQSSTGSSTVYGPKFKLIEQGSKEHTIVELLDKSQFDDVFATECIANVVDYEWDKAAVACFPVRFQHCFTYRAKYFFHSACFVIFMLFLAAHVITVNSSYQWLDYIIWLYCIALIAEEFEGVIKHRPLKQNTKWCAWNIWNVFAIVLLIAGLLWKCLVTVENVRLTFLDIFSFRMCITTSFLLFGIRTIGILRYIKVTGLSISMMNSLLKKDLLPFVIFYIVVILSFGLFFYTLLLPESVDRLELVSNATRTNYQGLVNIYLKPILITFGEYEYDQLSACASETSPTCSNQLGTVLFIRIFLHFFFVIVNLTMLNLLIAKFSLTVGNIQELANVIWRNYLVQLLRETRNCTLLPIPFNLISLFVELSCCIRQSRCCKKQTIQKDLFANQLYSDRVSSNLTVSNILSQQYVDFLKFQAFALRNKRSHISLSQKDVGSPLEMFRQELNNQMKQLTENQIELRQLLSSISCRLDDGGKLQ